MSAGPQPTAGAVSGPARADDALRESSAFQRAVLECADYAIISTGSDGVIRTFNRAAEQMLDYKAEEVIGKATLELILDREEVARRAAELTEELGRPVPAGFEALVARMRLGRACEQEWTCVRKDGNRVSVQLSMTAMRDEAGQIIGFLGIAHDITRRRTAQARVRQLMESLEQQVGERTAQLEASQQRYETLATVAPVGIYHCDPAGQCSFVNQRWCDLTGYKLEDALGGGWSRALHPEDCQRVVDEWTRAVREGRPFQLEYRYRTPAGATVWAYGQAVAECDATGRIVSYVGTVTDITGRKRIEEALQQARDELEQRVQERTAELARTNMLLFSEVEERKAIETALRDSQARLRTIIDSTPDWIFIKDQEHRYRMVNEGYAKAFRRRPEDFLGKNDLELGLPVELVMGNPAKGIRGYWTDDREVMDSGQMKFIAEEPGVVNGEPMFLSTVKAPLLDAEGKVTGVLGYVRDITGRKAVEAERERLIQELQAALAEVKTLSGLLPVCGWCKKIRDDSGYWNSVEGYLKKSSGVDITHGICPECQTKMMAELEKAVGSSSEAPPAP